MRKPFWTERKQSLLFGKLTVTPTAGVLVTLTDLGAVVAVVAMVFVLGAAMAHEAPAGWAPQASGWGWGVVLLGLVGSILVCLGAWVALSCYWERGSRLQRARARYLRQ